MANAEPIYDHAPAESSKRSRALWILFGVMSGAASWLLLEEFGIPQIFGIGSDAGLMIRSVNAAFTALGAKPAPHIWF